MYNLTKKEKLNFILKKIKEMGLTAYDIGKKTKMSASGIEKIINGTVQNPQENTLNKILLFLEEKVPGSEIGIVNEPKVEYKTTQSDLKAAIECQKEVNKLTVEIIKLHGLLRKNNIPFTNIFEEE